MNFDQASKFLLSKLEQELPASLTYHSVQHTKEVVKVAEQLCNAEQLTPVEKELVMTAALYHDAGFIKDHKNHEALSCDLARETLSEFDYTTNEVEQICELISATKWPQKPTTLMQQILCDADLHYLGTDHYFAYADKLYHEYLHQGLVRDRGDWYNKQIIFFEEHQYLTSAALSQYNNNKKQNLKLLTTRKVTVANHAHKKLNTISDWVLVALGAFTAGFGIKGFLEPNDVYDGGITGISLLLNKIFDWELSILIITLNLPVLIAAYFGTFKSFVVKTIVAILLLGAFLQYFPYKCVTDDLVLVPVFGGFFLGLGSGLAIRGGAALDGTEILAMYTIKKTSFTISEIILAFNVIIFSVAAKKFGINVALYSILTYFTASQTIGYVIEGIEAYTGVTIISENSEIIKRKLVNELGRGITVYKGERGFLPGNFEVSSDCDIIFTVITRLELRRLKNLVYKADPKAFVFANTIKEASGGVIKRKEH